ncbi:MAG: glycosyltransferase family 2 protein [Patescibacteria group bacterium]|nr:glycosyltransferase family 2 protein [Patescibacteria group bacterium]
MFNKKTVSAIVPVYNEEQTLANVIWILLLSPVINEVIAVNDGSNDDSVKILKGFGNKIKLINFRKNKGKGAAIVAGIKKSKGKIVAFFDADLIGFSKKHVKQLITPLIKNKVDATISQRLKGFIPTLTVLLSGERAYFKKDLIKHLNQMEKTRFGLEVFLNNKYKNKNVKIIPMKGLSGVIKSQKHGKEGIKELIQEFKEIVQELKKQGKFSIKDKKLIEKIKIATSFEEIEQKVNKLINKDLKKFFKEYVLKYLKKL